MLSESEDRSGQPCQRISQPACIGCRSVAEQSFELAAELGRALVPDLRRSCPNVDALLHNEEFCVWSKSTGLTRFAIPGYAAYASMKGAIEVFVKYLAKELGSRGITANAVAPGAIETDFTRSALEHPGTKDFLASNTELFCSKKSDFRAASF